MGVTAAVVFIIITVMFRSSMQPQTAFLLFPSLFCLLCSFARLLTFASHFVFLFFCVVAVFSGFRLVGTVALGVCFTYGLTYLVWEVRTAHFILFSLLSFVVAALSFFFGLC